MNYLKRWGWDGKTMRKCNDEYCVPTCEFCIYFRFNVDEAKRGNGWCSYLREEKNPYEMCEYFYCHIAYREDNWQ